MSKDKKTPKGTKPKETSDYQKSKDMGSKEITILNNKSTQGKKK